MEEHNWIQLFQDPLYDLLDFKCSVCNLYKIIDIKANVIMYSTFNHQIYSPLLHSSPYTNYKTCSEFILESILK